MIVTVGTVKGIVAHFDKIVPDNSIPAEQKVRYFAEPMARVVADEDLDTRSGSIDEGGSGRTSDLLADVKLDWGDLESGFGDAALVVFGRVCYLMHYVYAMAPYDGITSLVGGRLELEIIARQPFILRNDLVRSFGAPLSTITVGLPYFGGGCGSRSCTRAEPLAAVSDWRAGRRVSRVLEVAEPSYTTRAGVAVVEVRSAFDRGGRLLVRGCDIAVGSGADADNSRVMLSNAFNRFFGPYRVPNAKIHGQAVYSNTSLASSYQGVGGPKDAFASETSFAQVAQQLGIDSLALRPQTLVRPRKEIRLGKRAIDADPVADLDPVVGGLNAGRPEDNLWHGGGAPARPRTGVSSPCLRQQFASRRTAS